MEPLHRDHAQELFPVLDDARIYDFIPTPHAQSVLELEEYFGRLLEGPAAGSPEIWLNWAVRETQKGIYLGTIQATVLADQSAWIGYLFASSVWGQGYAREAIAGLIEDLFQSEGLVRLRASVDARNLRSQRLLQRLGFSYLGTEPAALRGEPTTDELYELCNADAAPRPGL